MDPHHVLDVDLHELTVHDWRASGRIVAIQDLCSTARCFSVVTGRDTGQRLFDSAGDELGFAATIRGFRWDGIR